MIKYQGLIVERVTYNILYCQWNIEICFICVYDMHCDLDISVSLLVGSPIWFVLHVLEKQVSLRFLMKLPGGTYCFWSISATTTTTATTVLPTLFNLLKLISSNHTWLTYGCGKNFLPHISVTLGKRVRIQLVPTIKGEPFIQSLQNLVVISPMPCFPSDKILSTKNVFCYPPD